MNKLVINRQFQNCNRNVPLQKVLEKVSYVDRWAGANHVHCTATVVRYELQPTWELCAVWTSIHSKSPNYGALLHAWRVSGEHVHERVYQICNSVN